MMNIIDLKDSPYKDSKAQNGFNSVSKGMVVLETPPFTDSSYPYCVQHGAMLKMDPSGLWRCPTCNVGCFQTD